MPAGRIAVLVVEDDPLIRMTISDELAAAGCDVFEAENAGEAIEILTAHTEIHVMFTDIDMPGDLDGLALALLVRDRWPPIKIIVTSGKHHYRHEDLPVEGLFVPKPYDGAFVAATIFGVVGD